MTNALVARLGLNSAAEFDPAAPAYLAGRSLSTEAKTAIEELIGNNETVIGLEVLRMEASSPAFWKIVSPSGESELACIPAASPVPTASEILLAKAASTVADDDWEALSENGAIISLNIARVDETVRDLLIGSLDVSSGPASIYPQLPTVAISSENPKSKIVFNAALESFRCSPVKYRFLELYRIIENQFIANVKNDLDASFYDNPLGSLSKAAQALESEAKSIIALADLSSERFKAIRSSVKNLSSSNRFAAAILRKVKDKGAEGTKSEAELGTLLIYAMRCAIVHAGEKDIYYERYSDGPILLDAILPDLELAVMELNGVRFASD